MTASDDNTAASIPGVIRDPITAGNLLRVNSDGSINVTGTAASGASLALLESHTAAASSSLDFTSFVGSGYDAYLLIINGLTVDTDAANVNLQLGTGAGPTWSGASYNYSTYNDPVSTANAGIVDLTGGMLASTFRRQATSAANIPLFPSVSSTAAYSISGRIEFFNLRSASLYKQILGDIAAPLSATPLLYWQKFGAWWAVVTAVTGVRLIPSTGTFAAGSAYMYGYKNA